MADLGALEQAIMDVLWSASGALRVRELLVALNEGAERPLAYNTVQTVAERLTGKGLLRRIPDGPAYRYAPTRSREEHVTAVMLDALSDSPNRSALFARLAASLDPDDARQLLDALRDRPSVEDEG